jgi:hypothetical protein
MRKRIAPTDIIKGQGRMENNPSHPMTFAIKEVLWTGTS